MLLMAVTDDLFFLTIMYIQSVITSPLMRAKGGNS